MQHAERLECCTRCRDKCPGLPSLARHGLHTMMIAAYTALRSSLQRHAYTSLAVYTTRSPGSSPLGAGTWLALSLAFSLCVPITWALPGGCLQSTTQYVLADGSSNTMLSIPALTHTAVLVKDAPLAAWHFRTSKFGPPQTLAASLRIHTLASSELLLLLLQGSHT
ncbi:hypothetical protein T440DRAFT_231049 [Plenodomus tracheiphilus IPT5]|uniref:Uncharacterized protein n=1 Tax=Plenodomus tracheiphilus IPT5 TaxID=1408161 RepID=A0A6A7AU26_9PLEO|nr:hypothetical protein T440DRAFT_231049 [Plenodomus tracheiphilus IPT5]